MKTGFCIICRENDKELSDEHVIPDSLGGVYHTYNVCKECNSRLGEKVDNHLVNNWFSQCFRYAFKIKGKKGNIPNPLVGTGVLESGQRVRNIEDESGLIKPVLIPSAPDVAIWPDGLVNIKVSVDASEYNTIDDIIDRILKRNGIGPDIKVNYRERVERLIEYHTVIQTVSVDIHRFKLALIKIAYEFAVDRIPVYLDDPSAVKISKILYKADTDAVTDEIFIGSGFADMFGSSSADFIDFSQHRHMLFLANIEGAFYGVVHISTIFCGVIKLSDRCYGIDNSPMVIAINDVLKQSCEFYTL